MNASNYDQSIGFLIACLQFGSYPFADSSVVSATGPGIPQVCTGFEPPASSSWDQVYKVLLSLASAPDEIRLLKLRIAALTELLERVVQPDTDSRTNALIEIAVLLDRQREEED